MLERLIVVGFVQWIGQPLIRLQFGLLVTLSYMTLQLYLRPFKRHDLDVLGIGAQVIPRVITLCCPHEEPPCDDL